MSLDKEVITKAEDGQKVIDEINAKLGYPRVHPESEFRRVGGGIHVPASLVRTDSVSKIETDEEGTIYYAIEEKYKALQETKEEEKDEDGLLGGIL